MHGVPYLFIVFHDLVGAPVAHWFKRWPTDLAVCLRRGSFHRERGSIAHSLSLSSAHRPDMTEILLKGT